MPSKVEIKARLVDRERALQVARELSASDGKLYVPSNTAKLHS